MSRSGKQVSEVRTGVRHRLVEGLLLRPNVCEDPDLVRDNGGVKQGEFGALLELLAALAAGVDLGVRLADLERDLIDPVTWDGRVFGTECMK
ncbi:hypothetical protein ROHU_028573 [Labeo rohita]|uniref:Uncharacterized protein n=1 Tax=Labeo rohita TaxID=84645 RepID=A0A498M5Q2_LABRO|nr:hypothetical protein ROHU_028573 [Labeo rohita]